MKRSATADPVKLRPIVDRGPAERSDDHDVARFAVRHRQFIDRHGNAIGRLPDFARDSETMIAMYKAMVRIRVFDAKAIAMQRTGQLGTFPSSLGQEAMEVGIAAAMRSEDVLLPTYRDHGVLLWRGVTMVEILQYWGGDERGSNWSGPRHDFPIAVPVASQTLHAAGVATAIKLRHQPRVAVCILGDGATSKGDFYEAINLAGVWRLPVVFVVANNRWAISVPVSAQTAAHTLAQKATAGGFEGEQVDGNDVVAVRLAVGEAVERARAGGGPSLVEALTYRLSDHSTADDASRYRTEQEVSSRWAEEPLSRLRAYMGRQGWWSKSDEEALIVACKNETEAAREAYLAIPPEPRSAMFDHLFATLPAALRRQREADETAEGAAVGAADEATEGAGNDA
jgi:pyruvate dehydrogenase E1 component alpha subunit